MICVQRKSNTMGWFTSDNFISNTVEIPTTEIRIMVGVAITISVVLVGYLILRLYNKYQKKSLQNTMQQEIRMNNMETKWQAKV